MPKFFVEQILGETIQLEGETAHHICRSLRMKGGEQLTLSDGRGTAYECVITAISNERVCLHVKEHHPDKSEPTIAVTLYQGVPKGDKMEDIIQKSVELGVTQIIPVLTVRCVSRPDTKSAQKKNSRYQKIALEAAKQSGRGIVPTVEPMMSFSQALSQGTQTLKILFYEGGGAPLSQLIPANEPLTSVAIFVGPEGGFEPEEVAQFCATGGVTATLGNRILRTQTAPIAALSALMLLSGNLD